MIDPTTNAPLRYEADRSNASGLGLAGLILGGIAVLIAWIPCVNILALIMAVVGLVLAGVALVSAMGDKRLARGMPIAGVVASLLALLVFVGSYVALGLAAKEGVERTAVEFDKANVKARAEMTTQAETLLDEAALLQNDESLSPAARDQLAALTDRIAAELETADAGFGNNVSFGLMLAELETRLQAMKNAPTTRDGGATLRNIQE